MSTVISFSILVDSQVVRDSDVKNDAAAFSAAPGSIVPASGVGGCTLFIVNKHARQRLFAATPLLREHAATFLP